MIGRIPDAEARLRAATTLDTNLVVMAGAGTGKTSLLVERALNVVGTGRLELDALGAITFTEKAAGEMRQRLADGLERLRALGAGERAASEGDGPAERAYLHLTGASRETPTAIADRALAGIEALDRATVVTIHALCAQLLRAFPIEAGVDPGFAIDAGEHENSLREELWRAWIARELGPDADQERDAEWGLLLDAVPIAEISKLAGALASFAVPPELLGAALPAPQAVYGAKAATLLDELAELFDEAMSPTATKYVRDAHEALAGFIDHGHCRPAAALAARLDGGKTRKFSSNKLINVSQEEMNRRTDDAGRLIRALVKINDATVARALSLLRPFVQEYRERYLAAGFVSFDGLLVLTRDLLRDHPRVRQRIKRRFAALLVDEFQDTDPLQYEIVLLLGERLEDEADDAWDAELEPGRLFVVGDAKQSIYRFRGADYAAFDRAVRRIVACGGQTLELTTNFRSVPGVLGPVNRLFAATDGCWQSSPQQPPYVAIDAHRRDSDSGPAVELWTVADPWVKAHERREAEGRRIAEAIAGWVERDRSCRYRDVSILLRGFTQISLYLRALRRLRVPFVVDGGREFLARPEVTQLLAILRCIARPWDRPSLLAYLRSPAGGCSDRELAAYRRDGGVWSRLAAAHIDAAAHPVVADALTRLRELAEGTRDLPVDATVREVVRRTQLIPLGAAAFEGPQRVANLEKLTAAAGELARDGRLSLDQVVEAIAEARLEDIKTDRPLADDAAEAVRITSIHRFKGLENRIVIVPDLARGTHGGGTESTGVTVTRLDDGTSALAVSLDGNDNAVNARHVELERLHGDAEETRVFYVALTRARDRLILLGGGGRGAQPWIEALGEWGYAADTTPADGAPLDDGAVVHRLPQPDREIAARQPAMTADAPEHAVTAYQAARAACEASLVPFRAPSAETGEPGRDRAADAEASPVSSEAKGSAALGRALGTVFHKALEHVDPARPERLASIVERWTPSVAVTIGAEPLALTAAARPVLASFLASPLATRLSDVAIVGRELPILLSKEDGRRFRGTIDLLYRDGDGGWVVADYKTDADDDDDSLRERYGPQMAIYREAVQRSLQLAEPPRAELWLLRHGRVVSIDPALD